MTVRSAEDAAVGCLLGTAVGDALGLPYEGVSRRRAERMLGPPDRHRFLVRFGMVSDDTDLSCFVAQSLLESGGDVAVFQRRLARRLRWWLLGLPAGIGLATGRAIFKLWFGFKPASAGVFSAGNGPAMRSPIIGATVEDDKQRIILTRASTRITHTDPKAEQGAQVIALAASLARLGHRIEARAFADRVADLLGSEGTELALLIRGAAESVVAEQSTPEYADSIGLGEGVTGYVMDTVPAAIHAYLSHQEDYRRAVMSVIECGGDADTTAAIVGGIVGAGVGPEGIPNSWISRLRDWPRSTGWIRRLGLAFSADATNRSPKLFAPAILLRNLFFLAVVLLHGFRRLLPPY